MAKKKQIKEKDIPTKIEVGVYWYKDDDTGKIHFDFEEMADEFEMRLSELDPSVIVMCSTESDEE
jgi:hypothetical protein